MFLAVLKRRHAGPRELVDGINKLFNSPWLVSSFTVLPAFKSILESIDFNETNVMECVDIEKRLRLYPP